MVSKINSFRGPPVRQQLPHRAARANSSVAARGQKPLPNRQVVKLQKEWPLWQKSLVVAGAILAIGLLLKTASTMIFPPSPIGYAVDPKICDPDTGISFKETSTCNPLSPICSFDPKNREITLMSVYDHSKDPARDAYANLTNELNRRYAEKYGLNYVVINDAKKFIEKECINPLTGEEVDCELYWVKIRPFVDACAAYRASPPTDGKERWMFSWDTDGVVAEDFDPFQFIDQIRVNEDGTANDASILMPQDSNPWTSTYTYKRKIDPKHNANTGFIAARIDERSCVALEELWKARNSVPDWYHWRDCLTLGICPGQNRSLHEQQAVGVVLNDYPCFKNLLHIFKVRDPNSKTRKDIVINGLYGHDKYCFMKCTGNDCEGPFSFYEKPDHPHVYRAGDNWAQPNAFPIRGKLAPKIDGKCPPLDEWKNIPIEEVRFRLIKEICEQSSKKAVCEEILQKI